MHKFKRAFTPSFFIIISVVFSLLLSLFIYNYVFWFLSVSILFFLFLYYSENKLVITPLVLVVAGFVTLLVLNLLIIRPFPFVEANYMLCILAGSFLLFNCAEEKFLHRFLYGLTCIFVILSIWGFIQYSTGFGVIISSGTRANSIFVTANTFAASLNVLLLPLIVCYAAGLDRKYLYPVILILFFAFLLTKSRGGWVALFSALVFLFVMIKVLKLELVRRNVKKLLAGFAILFIVYSMIDLSNYDRMSKELSFNTEVGQLFRIYSSESVVSGMQARLVLFDIAWKHIKQRPFTGYGLHTYQYYQVRDQIPPMVGNSTRYTHNDYLQLWMETGLPGVLAFISMFLVPLYLLIKLVPVAEKPDKIIMLSILTGLASLYAHAFFDFIFYVPYLLFVLAAGLGVFNQIALKYSKNRHYPVLSTELISHRSQKILFGTVLILLTSQAAIAQLAFVEAKRKTHGFDFRGAIVFYEIARLMAPHEAEYFWYEGAVLMNSVRTQYHRASADQADVLFEKGMSANPFATRNRLARAELHRDYPELLSKPRNLGVVLSWNEEAMYWRPNDPVVRAEYLKTLLATGAVETVRDLLGSYLLQSPGSMELLQVDQLLHERDRIVL